MIWKTVLISITLLSCLSQKKGWSDGTDPKSEIAATLKPYVMQEAEWAMKQLPETVTAHRSSRSAGGLHDFFSEGDYWWPDPRSADSPYVQRDGLTNPDNFTAHRLAMIRFSRIIGALASAWQLTRDDKYVLQAVKHCRAWFVDTTTLMNPNLLYAQAIKGRYTGRGIGIIDTIQLMEVVQGLLAMEVSKYMDRQVLSATRNWFSQYLTWLTTHKYGLEERNALNNHGTCWVMQVACFARFTNNTELTAYCLERYKNTLLPGQMNEQGAFPLELKRTKPFGYSLFNLDAMATICQLLSEPGDNLYQYHVDKDRSLKKGIQFLYPYVVNKEQWPYSKDVLYWKEWPVAQPFLVFGALAFNRTDWLETWKQLNHQPEVEEVIRNLPVRHPLIWIR